MKRVIFIISGVVVMEQYWDEGWRVGELVNNRCVSKTKGEINFNTVVLQSKIFVTGTFH